MTAPLTILVDIDAPVALWEKGLVDVARQDYPHLDIADAGTRNAWDLLKDVDADVATALMATMNKPGFYRDLEPREGAFEALHEMLDAGHNVMMCSTPSVYNPTCASDKLWWMERHGGLELAKRTIMTLDKTVVRGDVLIDDKDVITGSMAPEWTRIVWNEAYNQAATGPRMVQWDSWRDAIDEALTISYGRTAA